MRGRRLALQQWAIGACRVMGVSLEISGAIPPPGALMAANHLGFLDILALSATADMTLLAKREIGDWPVIGALARRAGTLFIHREQRRDLVRVKATMQSALEAGRRVVYFPEATSTDGDTVRPFHSGLLQSALDARCAVHGVALHFSSVDTDDRTFCWWGDQTFLPAFYRVLRVRRIAARVHFEPSAERALTRKPLARELHRTVTSRFHHLRRTARRPETARTADLVSLVDRVGA